MRNLQNEHWMRDLELEIKNISSKPIYHIALTLALPDLGGQAFHYGVPLRYGEPGKWVIDDIARPGDMSLKPGETYVFRVSDGLWQGFENYTASLPDFLTKRVLFRYAANFGDGTGFDGQYVTRKKRP